MNNLDDAIIVARVRNLIVQPPARTPVQADARLPIRSLHLNESPIPPSPRAIARMQAALGGLNRYPDHDGKELIAMLAGQIGCSEDVMVIGAGSNELLYASADITLNHDHEAIYPDPGFPTYAKTIALRGARGIGVAVRDDGVIDSQAMLAALSPNTRLMFVASPHNPTGGLLDATSLERLVVDVPDHVLLHFDEAYYEFGRHAGGVEALDILRRRRGPWIATRSFSKAYGLAGVRIGYGICSSPALAQVYKRIRINFSVNAVALAGALGALEDDAHTQTLIKTIAQGRQMLSRELESYGLRVLPSATNFVAVILPDKLADLQEILRQQNIYVLAFAWKDGQKALRITVGDAQDNEAVIKAISEKCEAVFGQKLR